MKTDLDFYILCLNVELNANNLLNYLFGTDNLNRFRVDFKSACNRNLNLNKNNLSKEELVRIIENRPGEAKRKHRNTGLIVAVLGGSLGLILGNYDYSFTSSLLGVLSILIALEIPLRISIINASAYTTADENMGREELVYRKAWNALHFNTISLAVLLLPAFLLKIEMETAYRITIETVEDRYLKNAMI